MKILPVGEKVFGVAGRAITRGKIVVCPTDTVYGLICDATNRKAVERLFKIKKRPKGKPIPIFVLDVRTAKKFAMIDARQERFLRGVWPGRVTAVLRLRRKSVLPSILFGKGQTVGLRSPSHAFVSALLRKTRCPLTGTSANISGQPASGDIKEIITQFKNRKHQPDLLIDAGKLPKRKPSKVVDLMVWPPKVLRN